MMASCASTSIVKRVAVSPERLRYEAVICRIVHRRIKHAVKFNKACVLVHLYFMREPFGISTITLSFPRFRCDVVPKVHRVKFKVIK